MNPWQGIILLEDEENDNHIVNANNEQEQQQALQLQPEPQEVLEEQDEEEYEPDDEPIAARTRSHVAQVDEPVAARTRASLGGNETAGVMSYDDITMGTNLQEWMHEMACAAIGMYDPDEPQTFPGAWHHPDPEQRQKWRDAIRLEFPKMISMGV